MNWRTAKSRRREEAKRSMTMPSSNSRSSLDPHSLTLPSNRRRSQRVLLQMPVILEMQVDKGPPVRVDAFTLVVNAHGGLVEVSLPLRTGQKLSLIHPVSGAQRPSKIVGM